MTSANHVIHYSRWWNPAVENQATDRVYRMGQTLPVKVYIPIVRGSDGQTVEEVLDHLVAAKQALATSVILPSSVIDLGSELASQLGLLF